MKMLTILFAAMTLTANLAIANSNPKALINTESVDVLMQAEIDFVSTANYDTVSDNLSFSTTENISVVQIFNADGELEFQLPVMSNNLKINKNLFSTGTSKLGFVLEGESELHFTEVTIK